MWCVIYETMFCYCYDDKQIIAAVYSFDYCSLITVLFHMIFKINISQDFDDKFGT